MQLENKSIVVTGAASGVGLAITRLFAAEGASILAADYHGDALTAAVKGIKGKVVPVAADVSKKDQCEAMIDKAVSEFGRLDVLVNNAGVMDLMQAVGDMDLDLWKRVMAINVDGPMYAMHHAVPIMLKQGGGVILNTASVAGLSGAAAGAAYTTSKHALVGLTLNTAWMYAKRGIRCNAMALGGVETNIMQSVDATKMDQTGAARCGPYHASMVRMQKPEDVAKVALFLSSDQSSDISGVIMPVDAGWSAA